ncbi:hypothetical protein BKA67DRAFT_675784 [Truncatella angustata]|uniref:trans-L-3-hydroxyproline dehydratase n=1 Tax=Truncatella angustata TaxID=152316 RepID=A0A9P9A071_9PEZI|nr:uncharacterized protein BKA67DRAFT_675784 [Truncatella angustata]KAH6655810.1 hypothetical protein BKA67DRAFT_675784 [Truncatella angustata]
MYGGFITPPNDSGTHFGVLFWHKDDFLTACGHGTAALGYWEVSRGLLKAPEGGGVVGVVIDIPSGRVVVKIVVEGGKLVQAIFRQRLQFPIRKILTFGLSFAGAANASVDAAQLGLKVEPSNVNRFISLGREVELTM